MRNILKHDKGFTLVELLVVVSIIGILSSVLIVALTSARAKSRDARRLSDINAIKSAIEFYRDGNKGKVPPPTTESVVITGGAVLDELVTGGFLARLPEDPINDGAYQYRYKQGGATAPDSFKFYIKFETETDGALGATTVGGTNDTAAMCATSTRIERVASGTCTPE